ncbi:MAG: hypothetical protein LBP68_07865, partial [Acidobacteriota bacterium]|nr:hypothetical protein [Acidobacteriota bacterium]
MNKYMITIIILCALAAVSLLGAGRSLFDGNLDIVGRESETSFRAVLDVSDDRVEADDANGGWSLAAPDGTARFFWSADYSKSRQYDVLLETDAQPFITAGLDP